MIKQRRGLSHDTDSINSIIRKRRGLSYVTDKSKERVKLCYR